MRRLPLLLLVPFLVGQAPDNGQKVLVQWTQAAAPGWETWHAKRFKLSTKKEKPGNRGSAAIDNQAGHIFAINVQGVVFAGYDHYAVEHINTTRSVRVTAWNDDPEDYAPEEMHATVWDFLPVRMTGGRLDTRQRRLMFTDESDEVRNESCTGDPSCALHRFSEFEAPAAELTRHGVWVSDELALRHEAAQKSRGWKEWALRRDIAQMKYRGIRLAAYSGSPYTYLSTPGATGVHAPASGPPFSNYCEQQMGTSPESALSCSCTGIGQNEADICQIYTTSAGEPGVADWESGNYTCSNNVLTAPSQITYGVKAQGSASGHMARVDSGLTTDQTTIVGTTNFTGTGLKTETVNTDPSNCADTTCRFECAWAVVRDSSHGNATLEFEVDITGAGPDNIGDGAWTPPTPTRSRVVDVTGPK